MGDQLAVPGDGGRSPTKVPVLTEIQPNDYASALDAAIASRWYLLTFLLPALVYLAPAVVRWRYILWLIPIAFIASCVGYFVYWRSIDWALMDYYRRTGYFNSADTWYVFMPIFRGIPNVLVATTICTLVGWGISRRPKRRTELSIAPTAPPGSREPVNATGNPYEAPRTMPE
ncbi:hypothetical protein K227x_32420 [Rubripirellula lacrimiformis]|uniref:Uncharacterized protein n=1 Tax=Rubripirellula lacrimiformis TaxID=1930273 RepID=A0A517NCH6_9BACT|nr:hypothetical protein [Rubripirellula lacrimiformis]QDT04845.1 hypothetical protein K227x_32420 [Rubripirellula lacrimiformis]